jgi:hypothetical protein
LHASRRTPFGEHSNRGLEIISIGSKSLIENGFGVFLLAAVEAFYISHSKIAVIFINLRPGVLNQLLEPESPGAPRITSLASGSKTSTRPIIRK